MVKTDRIFLLSLLTDMKKLSPKTSRQFKMQTMTMLSSLLDEDEKFKTIIPNYAPSSMVPSPATHSSIASQINYTINSDEHQVDDKPQLHNFQYHSM